MGRRVGRGVGEVDGCWDGGVVVGETVGLLVLKSTGQLKLTVSKRS